MYVNAGNTVNVEWSRVGTGEGFMNLLLSGYFRRRALERKPSLIAWCDRSFLEVTKFVGAERREDGDQSSLVEVLLLVSACTLPGISSAQ